MWTSWAALARQLLPRACPGCGEQLGQAAGLCPTCRAALHPTTQNHSPLRARPEPHLITLGRYQGPLRRSVRALKYGGARDLAGVLGAALARGVPTDWQVQTVVPVPMHATRARQRGFNQAELLAEAVARELRRPHQSDALHRPRALAAQARQHAATRADLHGVIQVNPRVRLRGPVLLVDDVLTTA